MGRSGTESASTDSDGNESLPDVGISIGSRLRHRKAGSNDVKGSGVQVNGSNEKLQFTWSSNWPMPASSSKCIFPGCTSFMTEYYRSKTGSPLCHKHEAMMRATSRRGLFHSFSDQQLHSAQTIGQSQHTSPQRPRPSENGHLNDGDYESPSRYPLDSPRKKVPNRPASSGLILLRRGSTPRSIRHGSPAMRATSQQGSPLKSGVTHRHSTSELKGNGALSAIRSPTLSPSISSEDRLDQQRSTGKLQFDTCSRAYHDQDKARAWMNAGCSPKLPPTDQEEPPARRTYNPGVRRGTTVETEAASISKSGPLEDCQDVEMRDARPFPYVPESSSLIPQKERVGIPRPFKWLRYVEPGFQQRAIRRLQLPENKAATERRLTEAIAAQQLRPGSAAADEKSEPPAPIFVEGDPRLLWTQPRSEAWHAAKQAEIRARPKRKARFGKAAESLRMQLRQDQQKHGDNAVPGKRDRAEDLPVVIRTNEQWMKVMEAMGWLAVSDSGDKEVNNSMVKRKTRGLGK